MQTISWFSINFPNPRTHQFYDWVRIDGCFYAAHDIIGFGGDLSVENLRNAYRCGIFPWHIEGLPLPWFCPEKRAILEFSDLHIPKSLRKAYAKSNFTYTIDKAFEEVIKNCAFTKRNDGYGTWITADFIRAYNNLHKAGDAHSVEVWDESEELVGGLYGVDAEGVFCGESMFFKSSNASKFALLFLVEHLKKCGSTWIDIQVLTPHFRILGAKEIDRLSFLDKLEETQKLNLKLF